MPHIRQFCRGLEINLIQGDAKRRGQPVPSAERVTLPEHGSADAKALGAACLGGNAFRRLSNGWEQMSNQQDQPLRCRTP